MAQCHGHCIDPEEEAEFIAGLRRFTLYVNPLDLIKRQFLVGAVVQLRGTGRLVPGDARSDFQVAAVAQVLGDAGPPETVIRYFIG